MDKTVLIYSQRALSNRHRFVFDFLLIENLDLDYQFTTDITRFKNANNSLRINYSINDCPSENSITIFNCGLLDEKEIRSFVPELKGEGSSTKLFPAEKKSSYNIDFDLFSACFYLLSRYEEYSNFNRDKHGRFCAGVSLAFKNNFLQDPLIDIWIHALKEQLSLSFGYSFPKTSFQYHPTYDIDIAWAYKHKGLLRKVNLLLRLLKSENKEISSDITNTWLNKKKDPYQVFSYLDDLKNKYPSLNPCYFFALGKWSRFDKNTPTYKRSFTHLIRKISLHNNVGIHPSYRSNQSISILSKERNKLNKILSAPVLKSRQHYLKLALPNTYRNLIELGIKEDYPLGFSDDIGFRASTSRSFLWYDLKAESISTLRLYPFQIMDVSLFTYLNLRPEEALQKSLDILNSIQNYGGTLRTIWHNSSFYAAEGWTTERTRVYEQIYEKASKA